MTLSNSLRTATILMAIALTAQAAIAKGGGHSGGRSASAGTGTGSKGSSHSVRGHTTKKGTYVKSHRATTPDKNFNNNYSTKGNINPYTGKAGTKVKKPKKGSV